MSLRLAIVGFVDHGKSTLIGRLLAETGQTQKEKEDKVKSLCQSLGKKFEYAFLLDALEEEQHQGITLDVTEVIWPFDHQEWVLVDTPGHREFLKKMVGGASGVEGSILIVDAQISLSEHFKRQVHLLQLLGLKKFVVLINKMDLIGWEEPGFLNLKAEVIALFQKYQLTVEVIPIAAWYGSNLLHRAIEMPWYLGPTLGELLKEWALEMRSAQKSPYSQCSRFLVQDVYPMALSKDSPSVVVGRVESGRFKVGDHIRVWPQGYYSRIKSIEVYGETCFVAEKGDAIGLTFADNFNLSRGSVVFNPEYPPLQQRKIDADLFWLHDQPLREGDFIQIKSGTQWGQARVEKILFEVDEVMGREWSPVETLTRFGRVALDFSESWIFDYFNECESMGRFVVQREGFIVGGGRWVHV